MEGAFAEAVFKLRYFIAFFVVPMLATHTIIIILKNRAKAKLK